MAWSDIAKVGKLLQSLKAFGGTNAQQNGKKGGGKGGHKWTAAGSGKAEGFCCLWDDCSAAQNEIETWGGKPTCYCCGRPKGVAKAPPLERLVECAYQTKLANTKPKDDTGSAGGKGKSKGKGKGKGKGTPQEPSKELLAQRREQRLAELKTGAQGKPAAESVLEAVTKTFNADPQKGQQKVQIVDDLVEETKGYLRWPSR